MAPAQKQFSQDPVASEIKFRSAGLLTVTLPRNSKLSMKTKFFPLFVASVLLVPLGLWLGGSAAGAATLAVTPSAISHQYAGMITLAITGLTNGETVTIDKFLDANTDGVINGDDLLMQRFRLTDNQVSLIGGATNVNVPGDLNPAASNITALLNFEMIDLEHIVGRYLFRLTSPMARFTPVTNTFNITNSAYLQSFTGQVRSNGTATAVAHAVVVFLGTNYNGNNFVGGTVANNLGDYTFEAAPGTYQLAAFKSNFVGDFTAAAVTLGAGATVPANLDAIPATRTISGRVADASNPNLPLRGILVFLESADGFVTISFTDTNGNFNAPVTASSWQVSPDERDTALHGYVGVQSSIPVDTTTGSVSGVNVLLPKGTAMIYGSIKDLLGNPLAGLGVYGEDQDTHEYASDGVSDAAGNYAVAALAGNWRADLSTDDPRLTNYVFSGSLGNTLLTSGQAVRQDFLLRRATNHITGYVRDHLSNPIAGVAVYASATLNGTNFNTGHGTTDGNGNYSLNVANGNWQVGVNCGCSDCDDSLSAQGFQCVNNQQVSIAGNNGVANFTAQPCGPLQVATTALADAAVGAYYNLTLQALGCAQPFHWSLSPGSAPLPFGMELDPAGILFGNPTTGGTFNFSVRVTDNNSATADQALSLTVTSLHVTTTNLPDGTQGVFYSTPLSADGGQPPYHWYLPGGTATLPPGTMNLSDAGALSGTPTASGTYGFWVGVFDNAGSPVVTQYLSLTIIPSLAPLQVTTASLPDGTLNTFYSQPVNASGGQTPYTWALAPGSASLPPGINLSSGGTISGTPTNSGTFFFNLRVTDAVSATADGFLSIYIPALPLQITTLSLPNAQEGAAYTNQLQAAGGQIPYSWSLAPGSLGLPPNLNLSTGGVLSGAITTNGTFSFIVRVTDANTSFTNGSLSLTINPKPTLTALNRTGNQFQLRLNGASGQTYSVQFATHLANPDWLSLLTTNLSTAAVTILDPNATNSTRYYRAVMGP